MGQTITEIHTSVKVELRALHKASKTTNRLESDSKAMIKCLQGEISVLKRMTESEWSQRIQQRDKAVYPDLRAEPALLQEFFQSCMERY